MSEQRSPERLVFFGDAVVAIALTLLVLPLADLVPEVAARGANPAEVFTGNQWKFYSFLLSFLVIGRLWMSHHHLFERVGGFSRALLLVDFLWLLTIVVLPFTTEMVGAFRTSRLIVGAYVGTVLAGSLCLTAMTWLVRRDPALLADGAAIERPLWIGTRVNAAALVLAFVLGAFVPGVGYYGLLLLLLTTPVTRLLGGAPAAAPPR